MSLSSGSRGSILFWMPSRPARTMAEKAMYGLHVGSEERLRHERRRLAVAPRRVLHDVFEPEQLVRHLDQAVVLHVDLALAGGRDFVVRDLDGDAEALHRLYDFRAQILLRIVGREGEI